MLNPGERVRVTNKYSQYYGHSWVIMLDINLADKYTVLVDGNIIAGFYSYELALIYFRRKI